MSDIKKPRPSSAAHRAVVRLVGLGGKANITQLMQCLSLEYSSRKKFSIYVTSRLTHYGFAEFDGNDFSVTVAGRSYVADYEAASLTSPTYIGKIVPPRTPKEFSPMRAMYGAPPIRPGSDDHKQIPSLMGNVRKLPSGEVIEG